MLFSLLLVSLAMGLPAAIVVLYLAIVTKTSSDHFDVTIVNKNGELE